MEGSHRGCGGEKGFGVPNSGVGVVVHRAFEQRPDHADDGDGDYGGGQMGEGVGDPVVVGEEGAWPGPEEGGDGVDDGLAVAVGGDDGEYGGDGDALELAAFGGLPLVCGRVWRGG